MSIMDSFQFSEFDQDLQQDLLGDFSEFGSHGGHGNDSPSTFIGVGTPTGVPSLSSGSAFGGGLLSGNSGGGSTSELNGNDNDTLGGTDGIDDLFGDKDDGDSGMSKNNHRMNMEKSKVSQGPNTSINHGASGSNTIHHHRKNSLDHQNSNNRGSTNLSATNPPTNTRLSSDGDSLLNTLLMPDPSPSSSSVVQNVSSSRPHISTNNSNNAPSVHQAAQSSNQGGGHPNQFLPPGGNRYVSQHPLGMMMPSAGQPQGGMYGAYQPPLQAQQQPRPPYGQLPQRVGQMSAQQANMLSMSASQHPGMLQRPMPMNFPTDYDQELAKLKTILASQPDLIPPPQEVLRVTQQQCMANMSRLAQSSNPYMGHPQHPMGLHPGGYRPPHGGPPMGMDTGARPPTGASRSNAAQNSVPVGGGANHQIAGAKTPWQKEEDVPLRRKMIAKIVSLLQQRKPDAPAEWIRRLPDMARRLEDSLYRTASSREVYGNFQTLKQRLQQLAVTMGARAAGKTAANTGSAPNTSSNIPNAQIGTMPPNRSVSMGNMPTINNNNNNNNNNNSNHSNSMQHRPPISSNNSINNNPNTVTMQQQMMQQQQQQQQRSHTNNSMTPSQAAMRQTQNTHASQSSSNNSNPSGNAITGATTAANHHHHQQQQQQQRHQNHSPANTNTPTFSQQLQRSQSFSGSHQNTTINNNNNPLTNNIIGRNSLDGGSSDSTTTTTSSSSPLNRSNAANANVTPRPSTSSSGRLSIQSATSLNDELTSSVSLLDELSANSPDFLNSVDLPSSLMDHDGSDELNVGADSTDFSAMLALHTSSASAAAQQPQSLRDSLSSIGSSMDKKSPRVRSTPASPKESSNKANNLNSHKRTLSQSDLNIAAASNLAQKRTKPAGKRTPKTPPLSSSASASPGPQAGSKTPPPMTIQQNPKTPPLPSSSTPTSFSSSSVNVSK